jgi:nucleotidyltransferase/DNA polymerase involved in DNA repair
MSRALRLCPDAVVLRPDMEKYKTESRRIAALMRGVTPTVEQVSIDEAYLDLGTAEMRDREPPARALARLALLIESASASPPRSGWRPTRCWPSWRATSTSRADFPLSVPAMRGM